MVEPKHSSQFYVNQLRRHMDEALQQHTKPPKKLIKDLEPKEVILRSLEVDVRTHPNTTYVLSNSLNNRFSNYSLKRARLSQKQLKRSAMSFEVSSQKFFAPVIAFVWQFMNIVAEICFLKYPLVAKHGKVLRGKNVSATMFPGFSILENIAKHWFKQDFVFYPSLQCC